MIRSFSGFLLTLSMAAALTFSSAQAQYYTRQPYPVTQDAVQPAGTNIDENGDYIPSPKSGATPQARGSEWLPSYRPANEPPLAQPGFMPPIDRQRAAASPETTDDANVIRPPQPIGNATAPQGATPPAPAGTAALPPEDQPETGQPKELPANLRRQLVQYQTKEPAGTLIVDTAHTYLYLVLGDGEALRYGIGVGREGFTWNGTERISRMKEWPDWFPPPEMIERQPYLPRQMAGGPGNPLGARALYLGHTLYRIHGTNQPSTIGQYVSSGCIRLLNEDIEDLYARVQVGTRVVVLPGNPPQTASNSSAPGASATSASVMVEPDPSAATGGTATGNAAVTSKPLPRAR